MHGDIGYKFCWLLSQSKSTSWTWISWDTNWERITKYQWTFCQATCLLEKILGIFSLRNKDPMFRPSNLYSKKTNIGKRWLWKPKKELAQYLQQLAFHKSNARMWQLILLIASFLDIFSNIKYYYAPFNTP